MCWPEINGYIVEICKWPAQGKCDLGSPNEDCCIFSHYYFQEPKKVELFQGLASFHAPINILQFSMGMNKRRVQYDHS